MPSAEKVLFFLSSALLNMVGVAILGYGMSAQWASSTMPCLPSNSSLNGFANIRMGLFNGLELKESCPRFSRDEQLITVFTRIGAIGGAAVALHALVVILQALALVASVGSILITLFNTFSNPYETYMGPIGLYFCSGLSACLVFMTMILYLANIFGVKVAQEMAMQDPDVKLIGETVTFLAGFYMGLPYIIVNLLSIMLVYLYAHAAYRQRQEQQKPTEDAPKEILMY